MVRNSAMSFGGFGGGYGGGGVGMPNEMPSEIKQEGQDNVSYFNVAFLFTSHY